MISDIKKNGWVKKVSSALKPYILLGRFDRPIGIWLLMLPGWWGIALASNNLPGNLWIFILFAAGAAVMRAAGCVVNDIWDRDLDSQVARTQNRPLANGTLTRRQAFIFLVILCLIGFVILLQLNALTIVLGVLTLPFIAIYPFMKRITWWPQAFLGLTFNASALMGWSAVSGHLPLASIILYTSCIFWTLAYDTIYAQQDKEDDMLAGIKSTALYFNQHSKSIISIFYVAHFLLLGIIFSSVSGQLSAVLLLLPAIVHVAWQMREFKPDQPEICLQIFKSSRDTGLLVFLAIIMMQF